MTTIPLTRAHAMCTRNPHNLRKQGRIQDLGLGGQKGKEGTRHKNGSATGVESLGRVWGGVSTSLLGKGSREGTVPPPQNIVSFFGLEMRISLHSPAHLNTEPPTTTATLSFSSDGCEFGGMAPWPHWIR